jgi:hypothetical protein
LQQTNDGTGRRVRQITGQRLSPRGNVLVV